MRRAARWTFLLLGLWIVVRGGGSILVDPAWEVHYAADPPIGACAQAACYGIYRLEVGNTGRRDQADVRVRLRAALVDSAVLPLRARTFDVTTRLLTVADADGGVRAYGLGPLPRGERVILTFTLRRAPGEPFPAWSEILVGVEPAAGRARTGSPGWIMVFRGWHAIFGVFL